METEIRSLGIFCWKKKKEKSSIGEEDTTVPPFLHGNSFTLKTPLTPTFRDFLLWILFFFNWIQTCSPLFWVMLLTKRQAGQKINLPTKVMKGSNGFYSVVVVEEELFRVQFTFWFWATLQRMLDVFSFWGIWNVRPVCRKIDLVKKCNLFKSCAQSNLSLIHCWSFFKFVFRWTEVQTITNLQKLRILVS